jgi:predicted amidohydrolase
MRLGLQTFCPRRGKKPDNIQRILSFAVQARDAGCDLVAFPEFSVNGPWVTYDPDAHLKDLLTEAEPIPGPTTDHLQREAGRLRIALGVGIAERGLAQKPFNAYVILDGTGIRHVQRKLQPTESEMAFYRGGGDSIYPLELSGTSIGVTICADNENSELHQRWHELGIDLLLEPHYDCIKRFQKAGHSWADLLKFNRRDTLHRRAHEPARKLGFTTAYVDAKDPRNSFDDHPEWPHFVTGKSACYGPQGNLLAENAGNEESLLIVDL